MTPTATQRKRAGGALLALAALLGSLATWTGTAGAQLDDPRLVTDYENYPNTEEAEADPACDASDVRDQSYRILPDERAGTEGSAIVDSLSQLPDIKPGDMIEANVVFGPDCLGSRWSATMKASEDPTFNPDAVQINVGYVDMVIGEELNTLVFQVVDLIEAGEGCEYQLDTVIGLPLAIVARSPTGSFYSPLSRGDEERNMLISAKNGALIPCEADDTTTTTEPPGVDDSTTTTQAITTSTTAPPTTTTVAAPTTTTTVLTTLTTAATARQPNPPITVGSTATVVTGTTTSQTTRLAETGSATAWLAGMAAVLLAIGAVVLGQGRRLERRTVRAEIS